MRRQTKQNATARKAALWFVRNTYRDLPPKSRQKFHNWLAKDARHRKQYDSICKVIQATEKFTKSPLCKEIYGDMLDPAKAKKTGKPNPKSPAYNRRENSL